MVLLAAAGGLVGMVGLTACGGAPATVVNPVTGASPFSPNAAAFSGSTPSALASIAASIAASASAVASQAAASASAATASSSARAASFEASVSASAAQASAAASAALAPLGGTPGNATGDITLTGVPLATTGGLTAVVVTITNSTSKTASYAVRIDFTNAAGESVDSAVVGAQNVAPGKTAMPVASSSVSSNIAVLPVVVQALRIP
ncbi:cytoskeletal protein RodZ [Kitasatospora sp. MAP12-22]|uniref:hypothetical protein n=1 Tax=Kitasatospora sp. MAP12-22 TaxID=3156301 RepID=UPI003517E940